MSELAFTSPKTWAELRAVGLVILFRELRNTGNENPLIAAAAAFVNPKLEEEGLETLKQVVGAAARDLGPAGSLALCDLPRKINSETACDADVMMLFIHAIILATDKHNVKVECTGSTDETPFDAKSSWPEIIPDNWKVEGNYSFRYQFSYRSPRGPVKELNVKVRAVKMDTLLLLTVLPQGKDDPIVSNIKIRDFIPSNNPDGIRDACTVDVEPNSVGLSQVLSRAAATQLYTIVDTQILSPLYDELGVVKQTNGSDSGGNNNRDGRRGRDPLRVPPRNPTRPGMPAAPWMPGVGPGRGPMPGFPGGFDDDLTPGGGTGTGGMLMGPGNAMFNGRRGRFGEGGVPPGVPPGARFDPYGPGVPPPGYPRPAPGTAPDPRRGGGRGDPNPDHLPPPGNDNEDPYNNMYF
eukprot:CAMPEP_0204832840 /NCGR_PEP_ID=MMETSP1346-20131115/14919_1 /ASSEMBLY_ACC=CAM_ASM_000771 /TAXON_ID=215587 /ORGANISM="Aplanochytrium stocchinoi, Strain GSBS06" /LENGTH=407 /DNA_ID=CAMNT_0051964927 /DNA_START=54 /DNA_END=1277 /DNA_ORIENTATION=+